MAFSSPEQAQRARPLRCWSDRQVEAVRAAAQALLEDWCNAWSIDGQAVQAQVRVGQGDVPPPPPADVLQRALQAALFGVPGQAASPGAGGALSREIRARVFEDLRSRLLAWSGVDLWAITDRAQGRSAAQAWSGDLALHWSWGGLEGSWWLSGETVARLVPSAQAPVPALPPRVALGQALAAHTLAVQARLAPAALRLGDLASLVVGDIVRLPHALDRPLDLNLPDGQAPTPLCAGWLGQRQGRKALELMPAPDAGHAAAH